MELYPLQAALYLLVLILLSAIAAYKCKSVRGICRRRVSRRRSKKSGTYFYLSKSAAENNENVADPFLQKEVQMKDQSKAVRTDSGRKSRRNEAPADLSLIANQSYVEDRLLN